MCFSTILSRVLHKYFVYIPPTPLSNGPSVNKVLSCLAKLLLLLNVLMIITLFFLIDIINAVAFYLLITCCSLNSTVALIPSPSFILNYYTFVFVVFHPTVMIFLT